MTKEAVAVICKRSLPAARPADVSSRQTRRASPVYQRPHRRLLAWSLWLHRYCSDSCVGTCLLGWRGKHRIENYNLRQTVDEARRNKSCRHAGQAPSPLSPFHSLIPPANMMLVHALLLFLVTFAAATSKQLHARFPSGTRTESAIQARQLTRERLMGRAERLSMATLFGREDCSLPEPSTLACTCGPEYMLCSGNLCRNLQTDLDHCGDCDDPCPVGPVTPACCGGGCVDLSDDLSNCGTCGSHCNVMALEMCCGGDCKDSQNNPEHCGACNNPCDIANGAACCEGNCRSPASFDFDFNNCGACGHVCPENLPDCCNGICTDLQTDMSNCGACENFCDSGGEFCSGGHCAGF